MAVLAVMAFVLQPGGPGGSGVSLFPCYAMGFLAQLPICRDEPVFIWLRGATVGSFLGSYSSPSPMWNHPELQSSVPVERERS